MKDSKNIKKRNQIKRTFSNRREVLKIKVDKNQIICYGCRKLSHYKIECPIIKYLSTIFSFKKKFMMTTWDDSNESEPEEKEVNICLMTNLEIK